MDELEKQVNLLYQLKDNYSIPKVEREKQVNDLVESICSKIILLENTDTNITTSQRTFCTYIHGKALNALAGYDKQAEQLLSKAVCDSSILMKVTIFRR